MTALPTLNAASPLNASDNTRLAFSNDSDETLARALDNTPADFGTMDDLSWQVEYSLALALSDDTYSLAIRIVNGATILAAATSGGAFQTVDSSVTNLTDTTTAVTAFSYVNTTADKATWDGASVELQQAYSQNMGKDGTHIEVDVVNITGNYTAAAGTDDLTATSISSTSHVGSPSLGQEHALSTSDLAAATSVGQPDVGQEHALAPTGLVAATSVGTPSAAEIHALTADNISVQPSVGSPSIGQEHGLSPSDVAADSSVGQPALSQEHALSASDIAAATSVGAPTLAESSGSDELSADSISAATSVATPTLAEIHALTAANIAAQPSAGTPSIGQSHALGATGPTAQPATGTPSLGQTHAITAASIVVPVTIDAPVLTSGDTGESAAGAISGKTRDGKRRTGRQFRRIFRSR